MIILRNNTYSDKEPTIRLGGGSKKRFSELTDKQLENIAKYENQSHPGYKRAIGLSTLGGAVSGACIGRGVTLAKERYLKNSVKGGLIGTAIGTTVGTGLAIGGHKLHTKQVKYAKEELARREKRKNREK